MSGKAIILASFGTSRNEARAKTIKVLEDEIRQAYACCDLFTVFTSPTIRRILKTRDNIEYHDLETMFGILKDRGYEDIICQPTYIIKGFEYDNMKLTAEKYPGDFNSVKVGLPLLSDIDDYNSLIDALIAGANAEEAYLLVGHGTEHRSDLTYSVLEYKYRERGFANVYISTIEGSQSIENTLKKLSSRGYKTVNLIPLMFVAGEHAVNDIAGDGEDSYKNVLKRNGYSVNIVLKGLGEYEMIRKIYLNHIKN